ncbi:MAG: TMEM175 family protein [Acetobacteraceae bacterium]
MSSFLARRLEVLSDIMFGVAMTVPVYSLPLPGPGVPLTSWYRVLRPMLGPLAALGCSFLFTGIFWFSHHRRLQLTVARTRRFLFVSFAFLFLIVLLPGSTVLYGRDPFVPWVATLYAAHLAVIAGANVALWLVAVLEQPARPWRLLTGPLILAVVFLLAALVGPHAPRLAAGLWLAIVLAPLADARMTRDLR